MEAIVVGKKAVDFKDKDGQQVKMMKYFLNLPAQGVEGFDVGSVSWNVLNDGAPPKIELGEFVAVEYNRYGRLTFAIQLVEAGK